MMRALLFLACCLPFGLACGRGDAAPRCAECGMRTDASPRWNAGLTTAKGDERRFDAPKCMLRYLRSPSGRSARDAWVLEYYGQRRIRADQALFVLGSDVEGPMGPDLVPIADRGAADRFFEEHHALRVLRLAEIGRDVLGRL